MALTPKQQQFCLEYLKDLNASQSAIRAGYARTGAGTEGNRLLQNAEVQENIAQLVADRSRLTKIDAATILRQLWEVSNADVNEIVSHRRVNCRHCYGLDFGYQRTAGEMQAARAAHDANSMALEAMGKSGKIKPFDELGGVGFDKTREPNHACPECKGEGVNDVFISDTRTLSPGARALYAGAKVTKDGIEVKFFSKEKYIEMLARHLSLFNDKLTVNTNIGERLIASRKRTGR